MRLVERISAEISEARVAAAVRMGCAVCEERRHYFEQFHVPGIAERQEALRPVFQAAKDKLETMTKRIRLMDGDRYVGMMRKVPVNLV